MNESLPLHILLQQDNERALSLLDKYYAQALYRSYRYGGYFINDEDFHEVFDDTLIRIWDLRHSFVCEPDVVKTLFHVTKHKLIDRLRHLNSKAGRLLTGVSPDDLEADNLLESIPVQEMGIWQTRIDRFRSAVDQLTDQQRTVIEMVILEGVPLKEVAERLGIAYTTVATTRDRALDKMKKYLLDNHITPDMADQLSQLLTVLWLLLSTFLKK